jgi:hypothetical protein
MAPKKHECGCTFDPELIRVEHLPKGPPFHLRLDGTHDHQPPPTPEEIAAGLQNAADRLAARAKAFADAAAKTKGPGKPRKE